MQTDMFETFQKQQLVQNDAFEAVPKSAPDGNSDHERRIIECLKTGPKSCRHIDRLTPGRGQAIVGKMRDEGHRIDTIIHDGERCYRYVGFQGVVKVKKTMQEAYYETEHWRTTARQRKEIDNFTCQQCGGKDELQTHHWVYELFNEDVNSELITFCKTCHESIHFWISGGSCHFPRSVGQDVAIKLGWTE